MPSLKYQFDAIGSRWWCEVLPAPNAIGFSKELKAAMQSIINQFDHRYSRFRDDSLVIELAQNGKLANPPAEMIKMLDFAKKMYADSDGAFDIAVGNTLHRYGYGDRKHGSVPVQNVWDKVHYNKNKITVPKGLILDFGGFGKGWLIDLLVDCLRSHGVQQFIVNGGGDLYVQSNKPIEFALEHPTNPALKIGQTKITRGALAASSTYKRTWQHASKSYHHIINPATNLPSTTDVAASFVRADTALIADTMATILVMRPDLNDKLTTEYGLKTIIVTKSQLKL